MSTPHSNLTISASDIAKLAGVGRSTVSNWRNRHEDFPQPVAGSASSPRFSATQIRAWLKAYGKHVNDLTPEQVLWSALDAWRGAVSADDGALLVSTLCAWRYVADSASAGFDDSIPAATRWDNLCKTADDEIAGVLFAAMQHYEDIHPESGKIFTPFIWHVTRGGEGSMGKALQASIDVISRIETADLRTAYVGFQERLTKSLFRGYDEFSTSPVLMDLLATAAESLPGPVHDPAAGSGRLLAAVGARGRDRTRLTGQEINEGACARANQFALVTGQDNLVVRLGDVFSQDLFERGCAQVVVLDPPYGLSYPHYEQLYLDPRLPYGSPRKTSMDVAWLQLALWYLGPQGRAFVLQAPSAAYNGAITGKVRTAMLQSGTIEAVVALPRGLADRTQIPLNLWVLARPGEAADPERVLLIDHSETKDVDVQAIVNALQGWREHRAVPENLVAGAIPVGDILSAEANVSPPRWLASDQTVPDLSEVRSRAQAVEQATTVLNAMDGVSADVLAACRESPHMVTISDLVKASQAESRRINQPVRSEDYSTDGTPVASSLWVSSGQDDGKVNLGLLDRTPVITRPGDILISTLGTLRARVDDDGGRVIVGAGMQLLRVTGDKIRPHFLAEMLTAGHNHRKTQGSGPAIHVLDLKVPLLPLAEQDAVLKQISKIRDLQAATQRLTENLTSLRSGIIDAIAAGHIQITPQTDQSQITEDQPASGAASRPTQSST
jgi:predicted DNA-binding transcriptional regulator AlpA